MILVGRVKLTVHEGSDGVPTPSTSLLNLWEAQGTWIFFMDEHGRGHNLMGAHGANQLIHVTLAYCFQ